MEDVHLNPYAYRKQWYQQEVEPFARLIWTGVRITSTDAWVNGKIDVLA
jgi:hypothetical protein